MPTEHMDDFKSVKKFNVFNTNNLWIRWNKQMFLQIFPHFYISFKPNRILPSMPAIQRIVEEGTLDMEIIVNPKVTKVFFYL